MGRKRCRAVAVVGCTAFLACTFSKSLPNIGSDTPPLDAPPPDAGPCAAAPTRECVDGSTLRSCQSVGTMPEDVTCRWGCVPTGAEPHCGAIHPAGGGATAADLDPTTFGTLGDIVLTSPTTIDGTAGTITNVTAGFEHKPGASDNIVVFRFKSLTIDAPVQLTGSAAIVLVADGPIEINAIVDAKGPCGIEDAAITPGPGGFAGGLAATDDGLGPGGGKVGVATGGAGGGGHGGSGGSGGEGEAGAPGAAGGASFGTPTIEMLLGGGGGGATAGGGGHARGGGGGGAVQLVSNTRITLASGGIDAGGCGGDSGKGGGDDGGGGGGAGGAILLEAPIIDGAAGKLAVNGGGGGAGDDSDAVVRPQAAGSNATLDRVPAPGAPGSPSGGSGGSGAAGATFTGTVGVADAAHGGGGGGGVGRIRLNTRSGTVAATGEMSPALDDPNSTCTAGKANVQ